MFRPGDWDTWTQAKPWPVTIWMRRTDAIAWFKKYDVPWPEDWGSEPQPPLAKGKRGAKQKYDWEEGKLFAEKLLNENNDYDNLAYARDGWRSQADQNNSLLTTLKSTRESAQSRARFARALFL